jgi:hypothetical protein
VEVQAVSGEQQTAVLGAIMGSGMQIWVCGQVNVDGGAMDAQVPASEPTVTQIFSGWQHV